KKAHADASVLYSAAIFANDKTTAAATALQLSMCTSGSTRIEWLWNAFAAGASVSKSDTFFLARFYLRRMQLHRTKSILHDILRKFKRSFRYCDLAADYFIRSQNFKRAELMIKTAIQHAQARSIENAKQYFEVRLAGIQILQTKFQVAQAS